MLMPGGTIGIVDTIAPDTAIVPGRTPEDLRSLTADFEAFKKLSDPSHRRCLGLIEWEQVLGGAGFDIAHKEHLDKEMVALPSRLLIGRIRALAIPPGIGKVASRAHARDHLWGAIAPRNSRSNRRRPDGTNCSRRRNALPPRATSGCPTATPSQS